MPERGKDTKKEYDLNATDTIAKIKATDNVEEVKDIAKDDDRTTVTDAASKRVEEIEQAEADVKAKAEEAEAAKDLEAKKKKEAEEAKTKKEKAEAAAKKAAEDAKENETIQEAVAQVQDKKGKIVKVKFLKNHKFTVNDEVFDMKKKETMDIEWHLANKLSTRQIAYILG